MAKTSPSSAKRRGTTTAPAPMRLPSTRERRPAMAALAVLLIVGGALASGWLALRAGERADYVMVRRDLAQGAKITEDDLTSVSLPRDLGSGVAWADRDALAGQYTSTHLLPGTIVIPGMVDEDTPVQEGTALLDVPIPANGKVASSDSGAFVVVFRAPDSSDTNPPPPIFGEVVTVEKPDKDSSLGGGASQVVMTISVYEDCAGGLAQGILDQQVSVAAVGPDGVDFPNVCAAPGSVTDQPSASANPTKN